MNDPEAERLLGLRCAALERSGFPPSEAETIARHPEINYLEALSLLRQGFPPELVVELLLVGHRPVF